MMNTSQPQLNSLPDGDLELLSAYLDNQLSVSERVGLERRLGAEPRLRAELEELRATAVLLRDLEPVRPPRSFTLDPASAPRRARVFPIAWVMQLGSGLAGMALVLLASVQILLGQQTSAVFSTINSGLSGAPMSQAAAEPTAAAAMEAPPQPEASILMATTAPAAAAPAPAPTVAPAAASEAAPKDEGEDQAADAAGGLPAPTQPLPYGSGSAGGAGGNMGGAAGMGGPPEIDASIEAMQRTGAAADTQSLPAASAPPAQPAQGVPPGLTLVVGVALLALAAGSYLYSRRRA